jgi:hypothetical protein
MTRRFPTVFAALAAFAVATSCTTHPPMMPTDVVLVHVAGGVAASSPTLGPTLVWDGRAAGFLRDELGAALAATHLLVRVGSGADPAVADATLTEQCWGDPAGARARRAAALPPSDAPPPTMSAPRALYYRLLSSDPGDELVVVSLLAETEQATTADGLSRVDLTLRWADGDWRLRVPVQRPALHIGTAGYTSLGRVS